MIPCGPKHTWALYEDKFQFESRICHHKINYSPYSLENSTVLIGNVWLTTVVEIQLAADRFVTMCLRSNLP
jgi:hypothetical protein